MRTNKDPDVAILPPILMLCEPSTYPHKFLNKTLLAVAFPTFARKSLTSGYFFTNPDLPSRFTFRFPNTTAFGWAHAVLEIGTRADVRAVPAPVFFTTAPRQGGGDNTGTGYGTGTLPPPRPLPPSTALVPVFLGFLARR